ncbi:hypothetical protein A33M_0997 [Rhodovulum sp. PH10]|nr:hypothetical protein A33M_0997 [Rhodovulum sp. PH10]
MRLRRTGGPVRPAARLPPAGSRTRQERVFPRRGPRSAACERVRLPACGACANSATQSCVLSSMVAKATNDRTSSPITREPRKAPTMVDRGDTIETAAPARGRPVASAPPMSRLSPPSQPAPSIRP